MPLIKNAAEIDDPYFRVLDDAPVPEEGALLLPAVRFLADAQDLAGRSGQTGVIWPNNRDVGELAPWFDKLSLVALVFPTFRDGRAYTQARLLRERFRFRGELRATGDILRDQFLFLHRSGFDAFEVKKPEDAKAFIAAIHRYSVFYQPAADSERGTLWRRIKPTPARHSTVNEFTS
jgi:uncharacterized protein (DUF934 family)